MTARVIFAGSPDFAVPSLDALVTSRHEVVSVLSQPDRAAGRGRHARPSAVSARARELGLPLMQPESLRDGEALSALVALEPDLVVVVAYGQILTRDVLNVPPRGCVNVHASILPRWRGASPVQAAILAGDEVTGVTLMQMDEGLDTGPVLATRETPIAADETAGQLHTRLAELGAALLAEHLDSILSGALRAEPQPEEGACYAPRIRKSEARIDWSLSAVDIERRIRAYHPWPVAETAMAGERLRIHEAVVIGRPATVAEPGRILDSGADGIEVATGDGVLRLTSVQASGRRRMHAAEFVRGTVLPASLG